MTTFLGKSANATVDLLDQYRLTYQLTGSFLGFTEALNASAMETRLMAALPQVGLVVRSTPQATSGDVVVVIRVQPTDMLAGFTVAQLANRADFSDIDFTLGFNFLIGSNVELSKVEFVGKVGSGTLPSGTSSTPSDATAKDTEQQAAEDDSLAAQLRRAGAAIGVIALVLLVAYVVIKAQDG